MFRNILAGATGAVLATIILAFVAEFTDWARGVFSPAIPKGAVVAFDQDGCPDGNGWEPFLVASGRFIIGAGDQSSGSHLTRYDLRDSGGAETHLLAIEEIPAHDHPVVDLTWGHTVNGNGDRNRIDVDDGAPYRGIGGTLNTAKRGQGKPHNNMPPYLALYFCVKN